MKSLRVTSSVLLLFTLLTSCSDEEVQVNEDVLSYVKLEIGNYWVYDWYEVDSLSEQLIHESDTVVVLGDTIISGKKYFVKRPHKYAARNLILFDSANVVYSYPDKRIVFTIDNSQTETIEIGPKDGLIALGTYQLKEEEIISVPAGSFECLNWQGVFVSYEDDYEHGNRFNNNYYSRNVGLVKIKTQFYRSPNDLEARLISFGNLSDN